MSVLGRGDPPTKVAYLQETGVVDEEVTGLDVPVDDPRRVEVLESSQQLVHEYLDVFDVDLLGEHDKVVQICLHHLRQDVSKGEIEGG